MSLYTEDVGTKLFCVISFFPFICAGMLSPSMAVCWEQLGRRGGLKQSGFTPGNRNAWIPLEIEMHECISFVPNHSLLAAQCVVCAVSRVRIFFPKISSSLPVPPSGDTCTKLNNSLCLLSNSAQQHQQQIWGGFGVGNPINGYSSLTFPGSLCP